MGEGRHDAARERLRSARHEVWALGARAALAAVVAVAALAAPLTRLAWAGMGSPAIEVVRVGVMLACVAVLAVTHRAFERALGVAARAETDLVEAETLDAIDELRGAGRLA